MAKTNVPNGTNGNISHQITIQDGNTKIICNNITEAKEATKLLKNMVEHRTIEFKVGKKFTMKGNVDSIVIIGGATLVGGWAFYKWIWPLMSSTQKNAPQSPPPPKLLNECGNGVNSMTLNDIGKSDVKMPVMLLGSNWMFSVSHTGKTIFAMEAAISLASGTKASFLPDGTPSVKRETVYLNFQMRTDQMKKRYFGYDKEFVYPNNMKIIFCNEQIKSINALTSFIAKFLETITENIVMFIDTVKDVKPIFSADDTDALHSSLRTIQRNFHSKTGLRVTFILVGQTNKKHIDKPIELADLSGSFNQVNLADSIIALGHTRFGKHCRLMKLLKGRLDELPEQVYLIETRNEPYLRPIFIKEVKEVDVLPLKTKVNKDAQSDTSLQKPQPEDKNSRSVIDRVPPDVVKLMEEWYRKGETGHGLEAVRKKYGEKYGLKYATEVSRLFEKYGIIVDDKKDEGQQ